MGDKQILISVAVEVCPKRAFGLSTCVQNAQVSLRELAVAIAFIKANLTLKLGEGQIVVSVSVEIGHAHSMTEKSANMIRVKQPPRVTIGEGLTPPDGLQPKHRSGEVH